MRRGVVVAFVTTASLLSTQSVLATDNNIEDELLDANFDEDFDDSIGGPSSAMPSFNMEDDTDVESSSSHVPPAKVETRKYVTPSRPTSSLFYETFEGDGSSGGNFGVWRKSKNSKFNGEWSIGAHKEESMVGDMALRMMSPNSFHGISAPLKSKIANLDKDLYASFEVQYESDVNCGGAYFKLFDSKSLNGDFESFDNETPYVIMFGPDKCGPTNKVHFIIKWKNELNGEWTEAHLKNPPKIPGSKVAHQYGFAIKSDDSYELYIDGVVNKSGKLTQDFAPGFKLPETIPDPDDKKPSDWVDEKQIPDASAVKPDDWDEDAPEMIEDDEAEMPAGWKVDAPLMVVNENAHRPEDWDDEEDGEWKQPMMKNPECYVGCGEWKRPMKKNPNHKGPWVAPMIDNPDYKGPWKAREIPNPNFYEFKKPHQLYPIDGIGFELWTVEAGASFDNIILTHDKASFNKFIDETFKVKHDLEEKNSEARRKVEKESAMKSSEVVNLPWFQRLTVVLQTMASEKPMNLFMLVLIPLIGLITLKMRGGKAVEKTADTSKKSVKKGSSDSKETAEAEKETVGDQKETADSDETEKEKTAESTTEKTTTIRKRKGNNKEETDKS